MSVPIRPPSTLHELWERTAVTALATILEADEAPIHEAVAMAAECADRMTQEWVERFGPKTHRAGAARKEGAAG